MDVETRGIEMRVDHRRWRVTPGRLLSFNYHAQRERKELREKNARQKERSDDFARWTGPFRAGFFNVRRHVILMLGLCIAAGSLVFMFGW